jgi:adenylylsulfate kinase-like enzyme
MVVWIIGLSGAGKTTLAEKTVDEVRKKGKKIILLDGDSVREVWGDDLGHDLLSRKRNADRICRLCQFLDHQGLDVVCAVLSIFPESREWCRENLSSYYEVFIDAPLEQIMARDVKGIYAHFKKGEIKDVAGLDLEFQVPQNPDLLIKNTASRAELLKFSETIANCFNK